MQKIVELEFISLLLIDCFIDQTLQLISSFKTSLLEEVELELCLYHIIDFISFPPLFRQPTGK